MDFYLITYDIPDDKRRLKVSNALEDYGRRVQFSVFEVWMDEALRRDVIARLEKLIRVDEDSIRLYRLCAACRERIEVHGKGTVSEPPGPVII